MTIALAELIATDHLVLVSSFNYDTGLFESFVPGLGGSLTEIRPNSTLTIRMSQTHTILSSGVSYLIPANTPTQVLVGATVSITLVDGGGTQPPAKFAVGDRVRWNLDPPTYVFTGTIQQTLWNAFGDSSWGYFIIMDPGQPLNPADSWAREDQLQLL